jgi:uncharacterized protein YkwD
MLAGVSAAFAAPMLALRTDDATPKACGVFDRKAPGWPYCIGGILNVININVGNDGLDERPPLPTLTEPPRGSGPGGVLVCDPAGASTNIQCVRNGRHFVIHLPRVPGLTVSCVQNGNRLVCTFTTAPLPPETETPVTETPITLPRPTPPATETATVIIPSTATAVTQTPITLPPPTVTATAAPSVTAAPSGTATPTPVTVTAITLPPPTVTAAPSVTAAPGPTVVASEDAELLRLVNEARAANPVENGGPLPPVRIASQLTTSARGYAVTMANNEPKLAADPNNSTLWHQVDGTTPDQRITAAGCNWANGGGAEGENVAAGSASAADVMRAWMNSPGHRANLLNRAFTVVGFGHVHKVASDLPPGQGYTEYWSQDFANHC